MDQTRAAKRLFQRRPLICFSLLLFVALLGACAADDSPWPGDSRREIAITATELSPAARCSNRFVVHSLDHVTTVPGGAAVRMFEANGGGVAINDLDSDGRLDIVLANHAGPNTILWNEGALQFTPQRLDHGDSRAASVVDVDGDGHLDIVFSRGRGAPIFWHNLGGRELSRELLPGLDKPLYAINWADLDGDGDLDLVGATYDAALLSEFGNDFLNSADAGVYVYENQDGRFVAQKLADQAQALALILADLDGDHRPDILVGNDFAVPDMAWSASDEGWQPLDIFEATTHSTMSLDRGDVDNDGSLELFASDMKPYADDPQTAAAWQPLMESMMEEEHPEGDPQVMENVLQFHQGSGYENEAAGRGVDATGWSWSAKFGDLDQDGFLDLYVVNGFMEESTFAHLPAHELVEENQALRNDGRGNFTPQPAWELGSRSSGRGMSMADLDNDGDLDIAVNNLRSASQLFENQLCGGQSLQVQLFCPQSANTRALGAELALVTGEGTYYRQLGALSGYLSGDPARAHFGFPAGNDLEALWVRWPDGAQSTVENLEPDRLLSVWCA